MKWQAGGIDGWLTSYGVDTGSDVRFWHLADCDEVPISCGALIAAAIVNRLAMPADPPFPTVHGSPQVSRASDMLIVSLRCVYYYNDGGELRSYACTACNASGRFAPAGTNAWSNTTATTAGGLPTLRILRRDLADPADGWEYVLQAWHEANAAYQDRFTCEPNCNPVCGWWAPAPSLAAQLANGDWGAGHPAYVAEAAVGREDDYLYYDDPIIDTRRARFISRHPDCLVLVPVYANDLTILERKLGVFHLLSGTGTSRIWRRTAIFPQSWPHGPDYDNVRAKAVWDDLPLPLNSNEQSWADWVAADYRWNCATIAYAGGRWELYNEGVELVAYCDDPDPTTSGAEWHWVSSPLTIVAESRPWDHCHHDHGDVTRYGIVRTLITDAPAFAYAEVCSLFGVFFADPIRENWYQRFGDWRCSEVLPFPGRQGFGLRLGACHLTDVHNEYPCLIGASMPTDPGMAASVGISDEYDYTGQARHPNANELGENFYGATFAYPLTVSLRAVHWVSARVRHDSWVPNIWEGADATAYDNAWYGITGFDAGLIDANADYPTWDGSIGEEIPDASASKPTAAADGEWRGHKRGYYAGWAYEEGQDEDAGFLAGADVGYNEGAADYPTWDPTGPTPQGQGAIYQQGYDAGYWEAYTAGVAGDSYEPEPPHMWDPVPTAGSYYYMPGGYWEFTAYANVLGITATTAGGASYTPVAVAFADTGQLATSGGDNYHVWRLHLIEDVTIDNRNTDTARISSIGYEIPATTSTDKYTLEKGPATTRGDNGRYYLISRAAPILEVEGALTGSDETGPGYYNPDACDPSYAAPALPPPEWAGS